MESKFSYAIVLQNNSSTVLKTTLVHGHVAADSEDEARGIAVREAMNDHKGKTVAIVSLLEIDKDK